MKPGISLDEQNTQFSYSKNKKLFKESISVNGDFERAKSKTQLINGFTGVKEELTISVFNGNLFR